MPFSPRFSEAFVFAAGLHSTQVRKAVDTTNAGQPVPYIAHLIGVAAIALEHGATEDEAIAALLHDAVEDQGGPPTRETIHRWFGQNVADIVQGCTDTDVEPKPPWEERKRAYLKHLPQAGPSVQLVSASDKLHNARSILADVRLHGEASWRRFKGGKQGTLWYYRSLAAIYKQSRDPRLAPLTAELGRVVAEIHREAGVPLESDWMDATPAA